MQNIPFGNLSKGMNVCDRKGDKVGTVNDIHQLGRTVGGPSGLGEGYVQVDTGFLGLGKDLYIPFTAFRDCNNDCCFLNVDKDDIDRMGWNQKPASIV